jgi:hypothetical protein
MAFLIKHSFLFLYKMKLCANVLSEKYKIMFETEVKGSVRHSTAISYPSIKNLFSGCQGHPLVCLPPGDRPAATGPESKKV